PAVAENPFVGFGRPAAPAPHAPQAAPHGRRRLLFAAALGVLVCLAGAAALAGWLRPGSAPPGPAAAAKPPDAGAEAPDPGEGAAEQVAAARKLRLRVQVTNSI